MRPSSLTLAARALLLVAAAALSQLDSRHAIAGDPVTVEPALATIERHAVRVHVAFQHDADAETNGVEATDPAAWTEQLRRWRMTWRITGYVVRDRRTVVSSDHFSPPGAVKSIEILSAKGTATPVIGWEFLADAKLCVFKTAVDLDVEPVPFATGIDAARAPLLVGNVTEGMTGLEVWAAPLIVSRRRLLDASHAAGFDYATRADAGLGGASQTNRVDLVVRPDGTPVGLRIGGAFDLDPASWTGASILTRLDRSVPLTGLAERAKALHEESFVHEIRLTYRKEENAEGEGYGMSSFSMGGTANEPSEDARLYGLSIAPNLLLVPQPISDAWAKRIERVTVEDEGDPVIEATYEGRVQGTGAFLVKLTAATLDAAPLDAGPAPAPGHAFLVHRVARRGGARRDTVTYDRSVGMQNGYGDKPFFTSEQPVPVGSFLMDVDGKIFGVATELRPQDAPPPASRRSRRAGDGFGTIAALFSAGGGPLEWAKSIDRRASPKKSDDAKRLPWLGVEYVPLHGPDVAEALDVSGATRDGSRGFLVNVVHAGSPAAKAGVRRDDLLLSAKKTSGPGADAPPIDLKEDSDAFHGRFSFGGSDGGTPAPWLPRRNALVRLLESFEIGTTYDLELWRDGALKTLSLTVEQSPRDFDSALKEKDDAAGLTVKELTYEVREALHLSATDAGVLVAAVEDGMVAFQARLAVNELIREMDGVAVADPKAFANGLADARAAGKASVRVVVQRLDKSRFVDLKLAACEPPPAVPAAPVPPPKSPPK